MPPPPLCGVPPRLALKPPPPSPGGPAPPRPPPRPTAAAGAANPRPGRCRAGGRDQSLHRSPTHQKRRARHDRRAAFVFSRPTRSHVGGTRGGGLPGRAEVTVDEVVDDASI